MLKLYEISAALSALFDRADDSEYFEIPQAELDALVGSLEDKLENCSKAVRNFEAEAASFKAEKQRLEARQKTAEAKVERLKSYMADCLRMSRQTKVVAGNFTIAMQKNGGKPVIACTVDVSKLPKSFIKEIPPVPARKELDNEAVFKAWVDEKPLPEGVTVTVGQHLRIR